VAAGNRSLQQRAGQNAPSRWAAGRASLGIQGGVKSVPGDGADHDIVIGTGLEAVCDSLTGDIGYVVERSALATVSGALYLQDKLGKLAALGAYASNVGVLTHVFTTLSQTYFVLDEGEKIVVVAPTGGGDSVFFSRVHVLDKAEPSRPKPYRADLSGGGLVDVATAAPGKVLADIEALGTVILPYTVLGENTDSANAQSVEFFLSHPDFGVLPCGASAPIGTAAPGFANLAILTAPLMSNGRFVIPSGWTLKARRQAGAFQAGAFLGVLATFVEYNAEGE